MSSRLDTRVSSIGVLPGDTGRWSAGPYSGESDRNPHIASASTVARLARGDLAAAAITGRSPPRMLASALAVAAVIAVAAPAAAEGRLDEVTAHGEIRICIWPDYYGITWRNPRTRKLDGIDIDMGRALAADLGVTARFIDSSFARLVDDLAEDACDVAMFAIGITPQRREKLWFTKPHLASDIYAITTLGNRRIHDWEDIDRDGTVVAVARGTLHEPVMRERLKHAELVVLDTPFAREEEVRAGRADVFMTDYPYSRRFLAGAEWARLVKPPKPYYVTPYAYAVKPGDTAWLARVDAFVDAVKRDGRLAAAAARHDLSEIVAP
jgi:cyclohexadienyl dehydratase